MNIFNTFEGILSSERTRKRLSLSDTDIWFLQKYAKQIKEHPKWHNLGDGLNNAWNHLFSPANFPNGIKCGKCRCHYMNKEDMFIRYEMDPSLVYHEYALCPKCINEEKSSPPPHFSGVKCDYCGRLFLERSDSYGRFPNGIRSKIVSGKLECINSVDFENAKTTKFQLVNICFDCLRKNCDILEYFGVKSEGALRTVITDKEMNTDVNPIKFVLSWQQEKIYPGFIKTPDEALIELGIGNIFVGNRNEGFESRNTYGRESPKELILKGSEFTTGHDFRHDMLHIARELDTAFSSEPETNMYSLSPLQKTIAEISPNSDNTKFLISFVIPNETGASVNQEKIQNEILETFNKERQFSGLYYHPHEYLYMPKDIGRFIRKAIHDGWATFDEKDFNALGIWGFKPKIKIGNIDIDVSNEDGIEVIGIAIELNIEVDEFPGDPYNALNQKL